ncbi:hypothetical protein BMS3Bbin04_00083 [bacterium BMS3Bbin04]|nr:hypothetical protein BMS3Bbin04_00083 [bacterium BMS3Bbin04]
MALRAGMTIRISEKDKGGAQTDSMGVCEDSLIANLCNIRQ